MSSSYGETAFTLGASTAFPCDSEAISGSKRFKYFSTALNTSSSTHDKPNAIRYDVLVDEQRNDNNYYQHNNRRQSNLASSRDSKQTSNFILSRQTINNEKVTKTKKYIHGGCQTNDISTIYLAYQEQLQNEAKETKFKEKLKEIQLEREKYEQLHKQQELTLSTMSSKTIVDEATLALYQTLLSEYQKKAFELKELEMDYINEQKLEHIKNNLYNVYKESEKNNLERIEKLRSTKLKTSKKNGLHYTQNYIHDIQTSDIDQQENRITESQQSTCKSSREKNVNHSKHDNLIHSYNDENNGKNTNKKHVQEYENRHDRSQMVLTKANSNTIAPMRRKQNKEKKLTGHKAAQLSRDLDLINNLFAKEDKFEKDV